jgi:hypothetical protein
MCPSALLPPTPDTDSTPDRKSVVAPWEDRAFHETGSALDEECLLESAAEVRERARREPMRLALGILTLGVLVVAFATLLSSSPAP